MRGARVPFLGLPPVLVRRVKSETSVRRAGAYLLPTEIHGGGKGCPISSTRACILRSAGAAALRFNCDRRTRSMPVVRGNSRQILGQPCVSSSACYGSTSPTLFS